MKSSARELFLIIIAIVQCQNAPTSEFDKFYWYNKNYQLLHHRMRHVQGEFLPRVKNAIIFIGDGMGMTTISASRTHKRQVTGDASAHLTFDHFPATAMIQTDILDSQISESAASSTALFCGVKTNFESIGVDATVEWDACESIKSHTSSIISWAQEENLKTGFVTTARVTHATPSALYAHSQRHMEDDSKRNTANCADIARQLIENRPGRDINVIFGGGMRSFTSKSEHAGRRKDGRDLLSEWKKMHPTGELVTSRDEMLNISDECENVLGIFAKSHMQFNADRNETLEPSLAEMTLKTIEILKRNNSNGFLLVVEGAKIDLAHHYNNAFRALDDTLAMDEAIEVAVKNVDLHNTLIIVTADHASSMMYSGFSTPKNYSVLGMDKYLSNIDKKPYQLLTYSSGLGYSQYNETISLQDIKNSYHKAAIPSTWSNHAGDDVPLYAVGAMSKLLFAGTFDQSYVSHAIAYAMCLFNYKDRCQSQASVKKIKVQSRKKASGMDALIEELNRRSRKEETEQVESTSTAHERETEDSNILETLDLIGNYSTENSAVRKKVYSQLFLILLVMTLSYF